MTPTHATLAAIAALAAAGQVRRRGSRTQLTLPITSRRPLNPTAPAGQPSRLRPFFSYFGSKWMVIKTYPKPLYPRIIEPFAGGATYGLHYYWHDVHLYDKDPIIASVWDYLIQATPEQILSLPLLPAGQSVNDLDVPQPARWLIGFWLNKGKSRPSLTLSKWGRDPRYARQHWGPNIRQRIADQVPYIKHWKMHHAGYRDIPNQDASWFVDPPYQDKGKYYRMSSRGIDYRDLGQWCRQLRGQVTVCENEGATWLPFRPHRTVKATTKRTGAKAQSREVIWTNLSGSRAPATITLRLSDQDVRGLDSTLAFDYASAQDAATQRVVSAALGRLSASNEVTVTPEEATTLAAWKATALGRWDPNSDGYDADPAAVEQIVAQWTSP